MTSVIVAYVLSRTTGLPQSSDDIGNWGQTLGIAMLFVGGSLLALSSGVLLSRRASGRVRSGSRRQAESRERVRSRERDGLRAAA